MRIWDLDCGTEKLKLKKRKISFYKRDEFEFITYIYLRSVSTRAIANLENGKKALTQLSLKNNLEILATYSVFQMFLIQILSIDGKEKLNNVTLIKLLLNISKNRTDIQKQFIT